MLLFFEIYKIKYIKLTLSSLAQALNILTYRNTPFFGKNKTKRFNIISNLILYKISHKIKE